MWSKWNLSLPCTAPRASRTGQLLMVVGHEQGDISESWGPGDIRASIQTQSPPAENPFLKLGP